VIALDELLKPKDIAEKFNMPVSTVRYYIKIGLLPHEDTQGGHARLRDDAVIIMRDIIRLQKEKRLTLREIATELGREWRGIE